MAEEVQMHTLSDGGNGDPGPLRLSETVWRGGPGEDPRRTRRPWPGQVSWSLVPPPGVLHLWDLTLGEEPEAKETSSALPGPKIPGKLNLIMP